MLWSIPLCVTGTVGLSDALAALSASTTLALGVSLTMCAGLVHELLRDRPPTAWRRLLIAVISGVLGVAISGLLMRPGSLLGVAAALVVAAPPTLDAGWRVLRRAERTLSARQADGSRQLFDPARTRAEDL